MQVFPRFVIFVDSSIVHCMLLFRFGLLLFLVVLMHLVCSLWHFTFPYWVVLPLNSLAELSFAGYAMRLMGMSFLHVRDEEVYQY